MGAGHRRDRCSAAADRRPRPGRPGRRRGLGRDPSADDTGRRVPGAEGLRRDVEQLPREPAQRPCGRPAHGHRRRRPHHAARGPRQPGRVRRPRPDVPGVRHRPAAAPDGRGARRPGRGHPAASDRGGRGEHRHTSGSTGRRVCVERRRAAVADRGAARRRGPRRPGHPSARRRAGQGPQRRPRHRADVRRARHPALLRPARGADAVPAQPDPGSHHAPAGRPQAGLPRPGRVVRVDAGAPRAARPGRRPGAHRPGAAGRARQRHLGRRPVHRGRRRRRDPGRAAAHAGDRPRRPVRRAQLRRVGGRRRTPRERRLGPPRPRPRRVRAQARPAPARAAPRGRHRGQRRPRELGSRHAAHVRVRAGSNRPGRRHPGGHGEGRVDVRSGRRARRAGAGDDLRRPGPRAAARGLGRPVAALAQPPRAARHRRCRPGRRVAERPGRRSRHRLPPAQRAEPRTRLRRQPVLPARGRRRVGRVEPVRAAPRPDHRPRPGRLRAGGRRARRRTRHRGPDPHPGPAGVAAPPALGHVVLVPPPRRGPGRRHSRPAGRPGTGGAADR